MKKLAFTSLITAVVCVIILILSVTLTIEHQVISLVFVVLGLFCWLFSHGGDYYHHIPSNVYYVKMRCELIGSAFWYGLTTPFIISIPLGDNVRFSLDYFGVPISSYYLYSGIGALGLVLGTLCLLQKEVEPLYARLLCSLPCGLGAIAWLLLDREGVGENEREIIRLEYEHKVTKKHISNLTVEEARLQNEIDDLASEKELRLRIKKISDQKISDSASAYQKLDHSYGQLQAHLASLQLVVKGSFKSYSEKGIDRDYSRPLLERISARRAELDKVNAEIVSLTNYIQVLETELAKLVSE